MSAFRLTSPLALAAAALLWAAPAWAQQSDAPDAKAGETLAAQGDPNGAAPCAQCHGQKGEGNPDGPFPRLADQSGAYLYKQLQNYADGSRPNDIMTPIAQALSDKQRRDAAAYYAGLQSPPGPARQPEEAVRTRGHRLATVGVADIGDGVIGVQACGNCHGPAGAGEPPLYPRLSGQLSAYATAQLQAFKSGARKNDVSAVMREISAKLSDQDMAAVAQYYESIRPQAAAK
ncbi:c-type cytochrome [Alsobacter sp. KACC 23698]|uniref:C-type cytochrome n=1 Tax=Alsobacter sp. KACC 23698 TaxID=3149229 RepID=A0AAU7JC40_9HYPH